MTEVGRIPGGNEVLRTQPVGRNAGRSDGQGREGAPAGIERGQDTVDVSDVARAAAARLAGDDADIRQDLVDRVRNEIQNGEYETPVRIAGAVDNILDSLS